MQFSAPHLKKIHNPAEPSIRKRRAAKTRSLPLMPGSIRQKPRIVATKINKSGKNIGSSMTGVRLSAKKKGNSALDDI